MPGVTLSLVEQVSDHRSSEAAYKFTIENLNSEAIELLSVTPRIPEDVILVDVKDPSVAAAMLKHAQLCSELTNLLEGQLVVLSEEIRHQRAVALREVFEEAAKISLRRAVQLLFTRTLSGKLEEAWSRFQAISYTIEDAADAERVYKDFLVGEDVDDTLKKMYEAKLAKLKELEEEMDYSKSASLATIQSGSFYAVIYVLRFPRSWLESRRFNFEVESAYTEADQTDPHFGGATTTVVISPKPGILTLIAVLSSLLGVILRIGISASGLGAQTAFYREVYAALTGAEAIAAAILAFVFFNVYEHTELGKQIRMGIDWRSAVLIGALCGLLADRIVAAIQGFVGL